MNPTNCVTWRAPCWGSISSRKDRSSPTAMANWSSSRTKLGPSYPRGSRVGDRAPGCGDRTETTTRSSAEVLARRHSEPGGTRAAVPGQSGSPAPSPMRNQALPSTPPELALWRQLTARCPVATLDWKPKESGGSRHGFEGNRAQARLRLPRGQQGHEGPARREGRQPRRDDQRWSAGAPRIHDHHRSLPFLPRPRNLPARADARGRRESTAPRGSNAQEARGRQGSPSRIGPDRTE